MNYGKTVLQKVYVYFLFKKINLTFRRALKQIPYLISQITVSTVCIMYSFSFKVVFYLTLYDVYRITNKLFFIDKLFSLLISPL